MRHEVWVLFPSADKHRAFKCRKDWGAQGYKVAIQMDKAPTCLDSTTGVYESMDPGADLFITCEYGGYWDAINRLYRAVNERGGVFVAIGDDMEPDPDHTAQEIAEMYFERFPDGDGILQPCGDDQGKNKDGVPAAARICGSPWFSHRWAKLDPWQAGNSVTPMPTMFRQFYGDELLKLVAEDRGLLEMRPDLTQHHRHWSWGHSEKTKYQERNQKYWSDDKATFERMRKKYGV